MYRITLQEFEGPLDLLLFFIKRDELDIYDIPIAKITDEFLEYVRLMEEVDLDGVGDFIYMAALLIGIKVKMLLPRTEVDEEGEPIDPRAELVEGLLEYIRYKEAAQHLDLLEEDRGAFFTRGKASAVKDTFDEALPDVYVNTSVFDLVMALRRVLTEETEAPVHAIEMLEYDIASQRVYVLDRLKQDGKVNFLALARHYHKGFVITTFLAVLELIHHGHIGLAPSKDPRDFQIFLVDPEKQSARQA